MDTSNCWKIVEELRGTNKVPLSDIPVEAWLQIIDDLYRHPLLMQAPDLFVSIVNMMETSANLKRFKLKKGQTAFDRGIGINTSVCAFQLILGEKDQMKALLLLPPELKKPLKWAVWCIAPAPVPSINKLQSYIYWASDKDVYEIFSQHPHVGGNAIDRVQIMASQYAGSLRNTVDVLEKISSQASAMYWRIKR